MSETVIDVVHNLQYKADVSGLEKAYASIQNETKAIDKEAESVQRLEALRAKTDASNVTRINQINAAIDNRKRKIEGLTTTITKEIQVNEALRNSLARQGVAMAAAGDRLDKTTKSSNTATLALSNLGRVAQDAPFGFLGIANNLNPLLESFQRLRQEAGSNVGALKSLASSFVGAGGIGLAISIVSSLLITFGDKLFASGESAKRAAADMEAYNKALQDTAKSAAQELVDLEKLSDTIENTNLSYRERGAAIDELQSQYPEYFGNLDREKILNGEVASTYDQVRKSIIERAKAMAQYNILLAKVTELTEAELELQRLTTNDANTFNIVDANIISGLKSKISARKTEIEFIQRGMGAQQAAGVSNGFWISKEAREQFEANRNKEKYLALLTEEERRDLKKKDKKEKEAPKFRLPGPDESDIKEFEDDLKRAQKIENDLMKELGDGFRKQLEQEIDSPLTDATARSLIARLEINRDINKKIEQDNKDAASRNKQILDDSVSAYRSFSSAVISVLDGIYDRQIDLLDREISKRRDNLDYAVELAQRGNVDLLNAEKSRIQQLEEERERAARKQQAINAALALSNAIVAVAVTAAESGVASIATIPAVLGAIAAGYAFVEALNPDTGFKEGKVDIQGPGTTTSDSIPARISKGESVINAASTAKYKPLLEAINAGTFDASKYHGYTAVMAQSQKQVAYLSDKQMAELMEAFQSGQVNVKQSLDSAGFSQQVETYSRRERTRFNHG